MIRHVREDQVEAKPGISWFTTAPNPTSRATGYDAGQRGWKLHAIVLNGATKISEIADSRAMCGIRPSHGWGTDLFIDELCSRCLVKFLAIPAPSGTASASESGEK